LHWLIKIEHIDCCTSAPTRFAARCVDWEMNCSSLMLIIHTFIIP
jgi:hypothetical protein